MQPRLQPYARSVKMDAGEELERETSASVVSAGSGRHHPAALDNAASLTPHEARNLFRLNQYHGTTSGFCAGYLQTNLTVLPQELAGDFGEYCRLNHAAMPLLYQSQPGEADTTLTTKESDVR